MDVEARGRPHHLDQECIHEAADGSADEVGQVRMIVEGVTERAGNVLSQRMVERGQAIASRVSGLAHSSAARMGST